MERHDFRRCTSTRLPARTGYHRGTRDKTWRAVGHSVAGSIVNSIEGKPGCQSQQGGNHLTELEWWSLLLQRSLQALVLAGWRSCRRSGKCGTRRAQQTRLRKKKRVALRRQGRLIPDNEIVVVFVDMVDIRSITPWHRRRLRRNLSLAEPWLENRQRKTSIGSQICGG